MKEVEPVRSPIAATIDTLRPRSRADDRDAASERPTVSVSRARSPSLAHQCDRGGTDQEMRLLADGLGWAEGPTVLADGRVCFVETFRSQVSVWDEATGVSRYAYTAGGPNSCVVGAAGCAVRLSERRDGRSVARRGDVGAVDPAHRREGAPAEIIATEIDGLPLTARTTWSSAPTAGCTSPTRARIDRPTPSRRASSSSRRRAAAPSSSSSTRRRSPTGSQSKPTAAWCGPSRTPGWCAAAGQTAPGSKTSACSPASSPSPTGWPSPPTAGCSSPRSTAVASTCSTADGSYDQFIEAGTIPTNCVFDGTRLLMTDAGAIADTPDASFTGQLWLIETGTEGGPTWTGRSADAMNGGPDEPTRTIWRSRLATPATSST